jgi:putative oxidoreductase
MIKIYRLMSFGLLPIRIIAGIGFILNGLPKLVNITGTQAEFASMFGLPAALALPVALLEVIGGIALIIGVLTRITSILFIILMIGATITVQISKGFIGGYQINLLYLSIAVTLLVTGPGRPSIEWNVLKRELFPKGKEMVITAKVSEV